MEEHAPIRLLIEGMHCASCVGNVERALGGVPGVTSASVSVATGRALVRHTGASMSDLVAAVSAAGYRARPAAPALSQSARILQRPTPARAMSPAQEASRLLGLSVVGGVCGALVVLALASNLIPRSDLRAYLAFSVALPVQILLGWDFYRGALRALRRLRANMDTLVALGSTTAFLYSMAVVVSPHKDLPIHFDASVWILTFLTFGRFLEARARMATGQSLERLVDLAPRVACVLREGEEQQILADAVAPGEIVVIRPAERVPVDGPVVEGLSAVDESMLTGEPLPIHKAMGHRVYAGTLNGNGRLIVRAERVCADTVHAEIVHLVESAGASRTGRERQADRLAAILVPATVLVAAVAFLARLYPGLSAVVESDPGAVKQTVGLLGDALSVAVAVLVVACPCAFGLATPTAVVAAVGRAAREGILVKEAVVLERAAGVTDVVFDKTGTLTSGRPALRCVACAPGATRTEVLSVAASVEHATSHPLGAAVCESARAERVDLLPVKDIREIPGRGLSGALGEETVFVGNRAYFEEAGVGLGEEVGGVGEALERDGKTVAYVARAERVLGLLAFADTLKPGARDAVAQLRRMGLQVHLLSGDAPAAASAIAGELGIDGALVYAGVPPDEKAAQVRALSGPERVVAMVGDGFNDAPALAASDLGVALGSGTDVAIEAADVVLTSHMVAGVARLVRLARRTVRTIRGNFLWALGFNVVMIPLAAFGMLPAYYAAAAMSASSLAVVTNSLLLTRVRLEGQPGQEEEA